MKLWENNTLFLSSTALFALTRLSLCSPSSSLALKKPEKEDYYECCVFEKMMQIYTHSKCDEDLLLTNWHSDCLTILHSLKPKQNTVRLDTRSTYKLFVGIHLLSMKPDRNYIHLPILPTWNSFWVIVNFKSMPEISMTGIQIMNYVQQWSWYLQCEKRTCRHRNRHSLLLLGLSHPTTGVTRGGDDRAFASTTTTCGAHHERTRVHGLLQGGQYTCLVKQHKQTLRKGRVSELLPCRSRCSGCSAGLWCLARGPYRHSAGRLLLC